MTVILWMCFVALAIFVTQMLRAWMHKQRHFFREKVRERYVINNPQKFLIWTDRLSLIEIKYFSRILDGEHIIKELENVLLPR